MSQRNSGYARQPRDEYSTPEWVTMALVPHIPKRVKHIYEPACGSGKMVRALESAGYKVDFDDISVDSEDFLECDIPPGDAIITNPPYALAHDFIACALNLTMRPHGVVAMLLRTDFDHAKTRAQLFAHCPAFAKKVVLTKRIQWFEDSKGSPSFNHAWFLWDWQHQGPPTLAYGP